MFYSQMNEDRILYDKYLTYRDGYFIELGAMDGVKYSNTLFFEKEMNWTGILIEPTDQFTSLVQNRPNCTNFNYAISEVDGFVDFVGNGACGGLSETMPELHRIGNSVGDFIYKVPSKPFHKITEGMDIKMVDLFCIDVEGGEYGVLSTFDWNIPVYIVLIEMSKYNPEKDEKCAEFLKSKGFVHDVELYINAGCEQVWVNQNNFRK